MRLWRVALRGRAAFGRAGGEVGVRETRPNRLQRHRSVFDCARRICSVASSRWGRKSRVRETCLTAQPRLYIEPAAARSTSGGGTVAGVGELHEHPPHHPLEEAQLRRLGVGRLNAQLWLCRQIWSCDGRQALRAHSQFMIHSIHPTRPAHQVNPVAPVIQSSSSSSSSAHPIIRSFTSSSLWRSSSSSRALLSTCRDVCGVGGGVLAPTRPG